MAKRENDLSERTLAEKLDGTGDKYDRAHMGKLSKVKRAKRKKPSPAEQAKADPTAVMQAMYLKNINTDLHARDAKGNKLPTLHDRIRQEGVAAQYKQPAAKREAAKARHAAKRKKKQ